MEIRNLNAFLKVAALKNFTQAARDLGYAQSNISAQIAQLEQELGVPLFNRIGRQVSLTQFGEELLPYAQELCSTAIKIENLHKSEEFLAGTVRIDVPVRHPLDGLVFQLTGQQLALGRDFRDLGSRGGIQ